MASSDIFNFVRIDERTALGGQPTVAQLQGLAHDGFDTVVNLAPATVVDGTAIDEPAILALAGLDYHHIPVDWLEPEPAQFDRFTTLMDGLSDRAILIHCVANFRVTAFYALHARLVLGWTAEAANALIGSIWNSHEGYRMSPAWRRLIEDRGLPIAHP